MLDLTYVGILLVITGFIAVFGGVLASSRKGETDVKGGAVLMIGPIPIIFGSDAKWASIAMVLAIVLVVLGLLLYLV